MEYSIKKDSYLGIPKCYKAQSSLNLDSAGILPILNDRTLSIDGQGVFILILDEPGPHAELMRTVVSQSAPGARVEVVELKEAPKELKDFFFIPENAYVISESDLLEVIGQYEEYEDPMVICFPLGCNNGSHTGDSMMSAALNQFALRAKHAVVVAAGNEGADAHHYVGTADSYLSPRRAEILVEEDMEGFYVELWAFPPERVQVIVQSPTGEQTKLGTGFAPENITYSYLFEKTTVEIDYRDVGLVNREQLVFIRFIHPVAGIWSVNVYPKYALTGTFHMWLPMKGMLDRDVVFLEPNPGNTITMPGDAKSVITVGGYEASNQAVYLESGRGYNIDLSVKPDFLAPCREGRSIGSSISCGIAAGAAALVLQWALGLPGTESINGVDVKNFLIRGCVRRDNVSYPNPLEGYGYMNLYDSFLWLR